MINKCEENYEACYWKGAPKMTAADLNVKEVHGQKIKVQDFIDLMDDNFGWCSNPYSPYAQLKLWQETGEMTFSDECNYKEEILNNFEL